MPIYKFNLSTSQTQIKTAIEKQLATFNRFEKKIIYLEAGHFDPRTNLSSFSEQSLIDALVIATHLILEQKHALKLVIGILIDDLGLECDEQACHRVPNRPLEQQPLPAELLDILNGFPIVKLERLLKFSERAAKNRGIASLKKQLQNQNLTGFVCKPEQGYYSIYYQSSEDSFLLAKQFQARWVAKCPLIMAQHYKDVMKQLRNRFFEATHFLLVDFSEMFDRNKVSAGTKIYLNSWADTRFSTTIMNVFYKDALGESLKIETLENKDCDEFSF
jgi:hypothetical protein